MIKKAARKRIKITKSGKLRYRHAGQNHFKAKESRHTQLQHKKSRGFVIKAVEKKIRSMF